MGERAGNIPYKPHEFKQDPYKTAKVCFHCGNSMNNPYANHIGAVPDKRSGPRLARDSSPSSRRARLHRALDCVLDRAGARDGVIDPSTVSRVYSGRPGCMCGCQGNYSTNPATIKLICNKIAALGGESTPDWHTAETPSRSYTAYLKKGKYAKDSRPAHRD